MRRFVTKLSDFLDWVAGWVLMATIFLVVGNILLRFFGHPIEGTYEWVGFLTAAVISLALPYCAVQQGHITVTFFVDRLSPRLQVIVDLITGLLSVAFLVLAFWESIVYGTNMAINGEVTLTTQTPFYPFIYLLGLSLLVLALVVLIGAFESFNKKEVGK